MYGERAEKCGLNDKDWWGKRPFSGHSVSTRAWTNKFFKRQLHKKERVINKKEIDNDMERG